MSIKSRNFLNAVLPLSILSFALFTKWWHAIPIDGPDRLYWGFPFPMMGEGFHTSMSLQIFVMEFVANLALHVLVWSIIIWILSKKSIMPAWTKTMTLSLWIPAFIFVAGFLLVLSLSDPVFKLKRPYPMKVTSSGFQWIWQQTVHPYAPQNPKD